MLSLARGAHLLLRACNMPWVPIVLSHDTLLRTQTTHCSDTSMMARALVWCACSCCSLTDCGQLQQLRLTRQRHLDADWRQHEHLRMQETDEERGSPIPASPRNTPSPELAGLHPDPAINDYVQEPQHNVEIGYRMEVEEQYDGNDDDNDNDWEGGNYEREGDVHISSDDEDNTYRVYLPQEDAVKEEDGDGNNRHSDEERDLDEGVDIVNDPAFNAGNSFDENEDRQQQDDEEDLLFDEAPAFSEHSAIRNAYVRAYIASAFKGASHDVSCIILDGVACALWYTRDHTQDIEYEGLEDMARTLPTAERRLGVNLDSIITYLFICLSCWQVHDPLTLYNEDLQEQCREEDCEGILYTTKLLASGKLKCKPTKVLPYVAPRRAIQHWLLRPGKYEELQQWRRDGDEPHQVPATHAGGDNVFAEPSNPMHDMHDAWGWRAIRAGLQHVYYDNGQLRVLDDNVHNLQQRFVSLPCGLVWQINPSENCL